MTRDRLDETVRHGARSQNSTRDGVLGGSIVQSGMTPEKSGV